MYRTTSHTKYTRSLHRIFQSGTPKIHQSWCNYIMLIRTCSNGGTQFIGTGLLPLQRQHGTASAMSETLTIQEGQPANCTIARLGSPMQMACQLVQSVIEQTAPQNLMGHRNKPAQLNIFILLLRAHGELGFHAAVMTKGLFCTFRNDSVPPTTHTLSRSVTPSELGDIGSFSDTDVVSEYGGSEHNYPPSSDGGSSRFSSRAPSMAPSTSAGSW